MFSWNHVSIIIPSNVKVTSHACEPYRMLVKLVILLYFQGSHGYFLGVVGNGGCSTYGTPIF